MPEKPKATTVPVSDLNSETGDLNDELLVSDSLAPVEEIDDRSFKFKVELHNRDGDMLSLSKGAIEELEIVDTIYDWWLHGTLIYKNTKDWAERQSGVSDDGMNRELSKWKFRGDGRDYIKIYIDPLLESDPLKQQTNTGFNFPTYTITLFACIYDIEDISDNTGDTNKRKKLKFWDYRYHSMQERNSYWNTVEAAMRRGNLRASRIEPSHLSTSKRSVLTGVAIQDLIEFHMAKIDEEVQYETFDDEPTWNKGSGTIFHSAGGNETAIDALDHLLKCHNSDNSTKQQPCILSLSRDNKWSLLPIEEYYTRAYDKQLNQADGWLSELFLLAGEGNNNTNHIPPKPKVPGGFDWFFNVYTEDTNNISDYEFTQMSYLDHPASVNIHSYDHEDGQFVIHQEMGDIENVKKFFQSTITDNTFGDGDSGATTAMILNKAKINNESINNVYLPTSERIAALNAGRNESIKQMLFCGNAIRFISKGMTNRQTGRLIGVDRQSYYDETDFDSKLLGCYFTTSVTHKISPTGYQNEIIGVKPYYFKDLNFNEQKA